VNALDLVYFAGALLLAPVWARKARGGWMERLGHTPTLPPPAPPKPRFLIHAVSVGEVSALRGLVPLLAESADVVVSAGTDTGLARASALFHTHAAVVRYPLDFSSSVERFLDAIRPDAVGLVELEVWPNFVASCARRDIPVAVINGRLSARSFRGYSRIRRFIGPTFSRLSLVAAQNADYAQRFAAMGVPPERLVVTDTMKWDAADLSSADGRDVPGAAELALAMGIDRTRPLIVAGSTAEDEEALLHAACPPGAQLLCAPRKPEHFDQAARALPGCTRRSAHAPATPGATRFLLDTIGELRAAYALADVVVMGRSFGSLFGSDPIEPVALGRPTLIGPRFGDFEAVVSTLRAEGGLRVVDRANLAPTLAALLAEPTSRADLAARGRDCVQRHRGATRRHADLLLGLCNLRQTTPALT
jgi:3-deoxy-D-manno-octulosonic-acid transferase